MSAGLRRAVDDLCASVAAAAPPGSAAAERVGAVRARLAAPLQVAVAGRTSSGKSTLVNALVGRRVAPTAAGECTRLVTRYAHDPVERVSVVLRDGTQRPLPFDTAGAVPEDVSARAGVDPGAVSHLEVRLASALLAELTVVDTPGLGGADDELTGRTRDALDPVSAAALTGAEAVLYVLTAGVRADDADVLATFTAATAGRDAGPVNVLAVLGKADTVVPEPGEDVAGAAARLAASHARALGPRVAGVLPVAALLAQTCTTGAFGDADAAALRALAALDAGTREALLAAADLFTELDCAVPRTTRSALLAALDLHGVRTGLAVLDDDPAAGTGLLRSRLHAATGLAAVRAGVDSVLGGRRDTIKAAAALASLTGLAADEPAGGAVARAVTDGVEALLARPQAHALRLAHVLTALSAGAVELPAELAAEVVRVGADADPGRRLGLPGAGRDRLAGRALERAGWWRAWASSGAAPRQARLAHEVHRAYFLLHQELTGASGVAR